MHYIKHCKLDIFHELKQIWANNSSNTESYRNFCILHITLIPTVCRHVGPEKRHGHVSMFIAVFMFPFFVHAKTVFAHSLYVCNLCLSVCRPICLIYLHLSLFLLLLLKSHYFNLYQLVINIIYIYFSRLIPSLTKLVPRVILY